MKFVADAMLGKLAKQLRLLGNDVMYDPAASDNDILRLSLEQERIILTRDTGLASRPLAQLHLLIHSDQVAQQVREVLAAFPTAASPAPLTRCSLCNAQLATVRHEDVVDLVPRHVYDHASGFLHCPSCGRVYWEGSHLRSADAKMKKPASS
jgi:hypothetical protein